MKGGDEWDSALYGQASNRIVGQSVSAEIQNSGQCWQSAFSVQREERRGRMYCETGLPGKGCGVVATRDIVPGELVIAETPLILLPWWVRHSMFPGKQAGLCLTGSLLCVLLAGRRNFTWSDVSRTSQQNNARPSSDYTTLKLAVSRTKLLTGFGGQTTLPWDPPVLSVITASSSG